MSTVLLSPFSSLSVFTALLSCFLSSPCCLNSVPLLFCTFFFLPGSLSPLFLSSPFLSCPHPCPPFFYVPFFVCPFLTLSPVYFLLSFLFLSTDSFLFPISSRLFYLYSFFSHLALFASSFISSFSSHHFSPQFYQYPTLFSSPLISYSLFTYLCHSYPLLSFPLIIFLLSPTCLCDSSFLSMS